MSNRYLKVAQYNQEVYEEGTTLGFRVKLEVVAAQGVSEAIFVYQKLPDDGNANNLDRMVAIASPLDLQELNEDAPATGSIYYRKSVLDGVFATRELALSCIAAVFEDIQRLMDSLDQQDQLAFDQIHEFGSSSSSSGA